MQRDLRRIGCADCVGRGTNIGRGVGRQRARDGERRSPSSAPPSEAAASEPAASQPIPGYTFPSEAKDLEAVIPDTICGAKAQKLSLKGKDVFNANNAVPPRSKRC